MIDNSFLLNDRNRKLSYVLNNGRIDAPIILFIHGFAGNKDENGLFTDAEKYFVDKGFNTLRFDMEGVGSSEGEYVETTLNNQKKDLETVIDFLRKQYQKNPLSIIGFSLGATVAMMIQRDDIKSYIFWSPAIYTSEDMFTRYDTPDIRQKLSSQGFIEKGDMHIGVQIIDDLKMFDPEQYFSRINTPIMIIHGTNDPRINYKSSVKAVKKFSRAEIKIITDANHSFKNNDAHREMLFKESYKFLKD